MAPITDSERARLRRDEVSVEVLLSEAYGTGITEWYVESGSGDTQGTSGPVTIAIDPVPIVAYIVQSEQLKQTTTQAGIPIPDPGWSFIAPDGGGLLDLMVGDVLLDDPTIPLFKFRILSVRREEGALVGEVKQQ